MKFRPRSDSKYADGLLVAGVALAAARDLGVDVRVGDVDALGLGDLREHEQHLDALLGVAAGTRRGGPPRSCSVDLEVRLLADPLPGERRPELVVHHLDLLVDQDVGQLDGRVGDGVLDDLVGELVAGPVEGVALEALWTSASQRGRGPRSRPSTAANVVVGVGQDLLAELLEVDLEVGLLAGERLLRRSRRGT